MQIEYSRKFIKEFKKCPIKIRESFKKRLEIFIDNKYNIILNNHSLSGKLRGYRSINVNAYWRAIFEENEDVVYFIIIGTHSQLYS